MSDMFSRILFSVVPVLCPWDRCGKGTVGNIHLATEPRQDLPGAVATVLESFQFGSELVRKEFALLPMKKNLFNHLF